MFNISLSDARHSTLLESEENNHRREKKKKKNEKGPTQRTPNRHSHQNAKSNKVLLTSLRYLVIVCCVAYVCVCAALIGAAGCRCCPSKSVQFGERHQTICVMCTLKGDHSRRIRDVPYRGGYYKIKRRANLTGDAVTMLSHFAEWISVKIASKCVCMCVGVVNQRIQSTWW